jgi:hypothetical protein
MVAASKAFRSRIVEACRRDLRTDVAAVSLGAFRCVDLLRLWSYLPADIIAQLRSEADTLISSGSAKAHELGGRFVVVPPANTRTPLPIDTPTLCVEQFETVVPQTKWSISELPTKDQVDIIVGDVSLRNRVSVAGLAMRQLLAAASNG